MDQNQNNSTKDSPWNSPEKKRWKHRRFWVFVVFVIVIILIFGFFDDNHHGSYNENQNNIHTIAVTGHGEVFATSTVATFSFSASDKEATVVDAQSKMAVKANAAIDYLKQNGVAAADIQTTDYSVNPTYANSVTPVYCPPYGGCPSSSPTINGYEVSETVSVKLRDPSKSGTILQGVGQAGVSNISGLSFTIDNPEALQEQARKMAIEQAEKKAKQLGKDLGVRLNNIVSFDENGNNPIPMAYDKATVSSVGSAPPAPAPNIQIGQNKITSDVTITYEIK